MYGFTFPSSYITTPKYLYCDVRYMISLDGVVHWCCIGVPRDGYMATTSVLSLLQFTVSRHFLQYAYIILMLCCTPFSSALNVAMSSAKKHDVTLYGSIVVESCEWLSVH